MGCTEFLSCKEACGVSLEAVKEGARGLRPRLLKKPVLPESVRLVLRFDGSAALVLVGERPDLVKLLMSRVPDLGFQALRS